MLDKNPDDLEIIDVREPYEHKRVRIRDSKLIPLSIIPLKVKEIDWNKKVVLVCKSGARSLNVAQLLSNTGKNVYNLAGGISNLSAIDCPYIEK